MINKKGIALKTFIFTSGLITLVVVISFAILYFSLPDYYYYTKNNRLKTNTNILEQSLKAASSAAVCSDLISAFSIENNADVVSFDSEGLMLPELSSPFIRLEGGKTDDGSTAHFTVKILQRHDLDEPSENNNRVWFFNSAGVLDSRPAANLTKDINNDLIAYIIVTGTLQPINEAQSVIISLMPFLLLIDILIAFIAAYFYAKQLSKPIIAISGAASEMQKMTPGVQSGIRTDDELGELSRNLDGMYNSLCANMEALQCEMERVNQLEKSKTDFMRAASHELKTPIAALNGIVEGMIDHVGIYKNKEKYLKESKRLIDHLSDLVNEILGVSRLETLEDTMLIEPVDVSALLAFTLRRYHLLIEEKDLRVKIENFNLIYETDEKLLRTTLSNIILNALKYTEKAGEIHIFFVEEEAVLSVENQCVNIPEETLKKLFEPFYTVDYSRHRSKSGTGLGLYIVRKNLERLRLPYELENTPLGIKFSIKFTESTH